MRSPILFQLLITLIFCLIKYVVTNQIISIQLYAYYNALHHKTRFYESVRPDASSDLVLRRGNFVNLAIKLAEQFDPLSQLQLRIMFGPNPSAEDGSIFLVPVIESSDFTDNWSAQLFKIDGNKVEIKLFIPSNASVGNYRINFALTENEKITSEVRIPNSIYVLFNPWSSADTVYMPDQTDIDEYVLNTQGIIFMGDVSSPLARDWPYDQFKKNSIQAAIYILDVMNLPMKSRADPVIVSRMFSQMANSNDDQGILFGKWQEPYAPYKAPMAWMSSGEVLDQFVDSGGKDVKYAQCWVFAGITTTLARTLGIPAKTITNYISGHDTDKSLTIDTFYDSEGNQMRGSNNDADWNYHVWTEVWMTRPDLPAEYSGPGWQVIDGTPQEPSENIFRMGPANVEAAKNGDVHLSHDTQFLYAEVNADRISWIKDVQTGKWRKLNVYTDNVGRLVLTKAKGSDQAEDITLKYKFQEGSQEERTGMLKAGKNLDIPYVYDPSIVLRKSKGDIDFEFMTNNKQTMGENMVISYVVTNRASIQRTIFLNFNLKSIYYSGANGYNLRKIQDQILLGPKESRNFTIVITPDEYLPKNVEFNLYKAVAYLRVEENNIDLIDDIKIVLNQPELEVKKLDDRKSSTLSVHLVNPLKDRPLTGCKLVIKDGIKKKIEQKIGCISAGGNFDYKYASNGDKVIFMLDCKELHDIRGSGYLKTLDN